MHHVVTYFDPQPAPAEVPVRLANPFAPGPPHPLAHRAAEALRLRLRQGELARGLDLGVKLPWPVQYFRAAPEGAPRRQFRGD